MRRKIRLVREGSENYSMYYYEGNGRRYGSIRFLLGGLCGDMIKGWFGLKRHVPAGGSVEGYLSITFTPIKKGGKK